VTTHSKLEWQHTQKGWALQLKKELSTTAQERVKHNSSRKYFQEDHEGSSWENREKLDWAWIRIWLNWVYQNLDFLSLSLNMASKLSGVMILLDGSGSFLERDNPFKNRYSETTKEIIFRPEPL
jgi:hypothetical protein